MSRPISGSPLRDLSAGGAVIQNTEDMIFPGRPLIINPLTVFLPGPPGTSDMNRALKKFLNIGGVNE